MTPPVATIEIHPHGTACGRWLARWRVAHFGGAGQGDSIENALADAAEQIAVARSELAELDVHLEAAIAAWSAS